MIIKLHSVRCLGVALLVGVFTACSRSTTDLTTTAISSPTSAPTSAASDAIATISEIQNLPVFVRLLSAPQEQPAKEGMGLKTGETVRTQGKALTQIDLKNGLAFRLAGDAVLTLQPDNRLHLTAGDMITWVQPGKKLPTEIVTPVAIAGIRGTTVFVKIPKDPKEGVLFFAWEGSVAVKLAGQTEEVLLKTADEVRIKPGDRDIRQIRQRVRRLSRAEWRQKRQTDPLLRSFKKAKMSTLPIIEQIKPGQLSLQTLPNAPKPTTKQADNPQDGDRVQAKRINPTPGKADKVLLHTRFEPPKKERPDHDQAERDNRDRPPAKPPKRDHPHHPKPEVAAQFEPKKERHSEADERHHPDHEPKGRDRHH
ncbi:MAG: FecR domain-containing protein [Leptolyngbya sp. BL-A-14]